MSASKNLGTWTKSEYAADIEVAVAEERIFLAQLAERYVEEDVHEEGILEGWYAFHY